MKRKRVFAFLVFSILVTSARSQVVFSDDFDRPDGAVGNGWLSSSGNIDGDMEISGQRLITSGCDSGVQGIHRPLTTNKPLRIEATITETDGFDLVGSRFEAALVINNSGGNAFSDGFGLFLNRTEADTSNSHIQRLDNGLVGSKVFSPFQFESEIDVRFTIFPNGQISGVITELGVGAFPFTLPPVTPTAAGGNFALAMDNKAAGSTMPPTLDDLVLTEEPGECFMVFGSGPGSEFIQPASFQFQTQVAGIHDFYYVLMDEIPDLILPIQSRGFLGWGGKKGGPPSFVVGEVGDVPAETPSWMLDMSFSVQVLMWNPEVFPQLPEQHTPGLQVTLLPNGGVSSTQYGTTVGGLELWHEIGVNGAGQRVIRFPFHVPGL